MNYSPFSLKKMLSAREQNNGWEQQKKERTEHKGTLEMMDLFLILIMVIVSGVNICIKTH